MVVLNIKQTYVCYNNIIVSRFYLIFWLYSDRKDLITCTKNIGIPTVKECTISCVRIANSDVFSNLSLTSIYSASRNENR